MSDKGIQADPEKLKAIVNIPIPKNVSELQSFLGVVGYYRKFVKDFAKISKPLYDLTRLQVKYNWSDTYSSF